MRGARTTQPRRTIRALTLAALAAAGALTAATPASASLSTAIAYPPAKVSQISLTSTTICATVGPTFYTDVPPRYVLALFDGDTQVSPRTTNFCSIATGLLPGTAYTLTLKGTLESSPDAPLTRDFGNVAFTTAVDAEVKELTASSATVCVPPAMQISGGFMMRQVVFDDRPVESRTVLGDSAGDCQTITGLTAGTAYRLGMATGLPGQPESELVVGAEAIFTTHSTASVSVSSITASSARVCQTGFILAVVRRTVLFDGPVPLGESAGGCVTATGLRPGTSYTLSLRVADAGAPDSELVEIGTVSFTTDRGYVTVTEVSPTSAKLCMPEGARLALNAPWSAEENGAQFFGTTAACAVATGLTPDRRYDAMIVDASKMMLGAVSIRTTKDPSFVLATATNITTDSVTICAEGRRPASENWYVVNEPVDGIQVERSAGGDRCQTVSGLMPGKDYVFAFFHGDTGEEALDFETVVRFRTLGTPADRTPTVDQITSTSVRICGGGPVRPPAIERLVVFDGGTKLAESNAICQTVTGLTPGSTYTLTLKSTLAGGPDSALVTEGSVTFDTLPREAFVYDVTGAATLKTLVKGSVALRGSLDATVKAGTGALTATLALDKSTANLVALGFLPVTAQIALISTVPVTGAVAGGSLSAVAKLRIKVPQVSVFGVPIAGGSSCQAKQISSVALQSTQSEFSPFLGGPIAGTFSISNLTGCGALTGILSPLTAGTGNALMLNLAPRA